MTEIGTDLRALIIRARKDPDRWKRTTGKARLSQAELAGRAGTSEVWLRQIETGYTETASADTLGNICAVLGIDPGLLRQLGYGDVADAVDARVMLEQGVVPDDLYSSESSAEDYIREAPGLTDSEKNFLVAALHAVRKEEPLAASMWRRRKKTG